MKDEDSYIPDDEAMRVVERLERRWASFLERLAAYDGGARPKLTRGEAEAFYEDDEDPKDVKAAYGNAGACRVVRFPNVRVDDVGGGKIG